MKYYAVFKVVAEEHVELEGATSWQEAAKAALAMKPPTLSREGLLECVGVIQGEGYGVYDAAHELVGPCHRCGFQILEGRCNKGVCKTKHTGPGGYTTTEHGHMVWCSKECRDQDPEDPERDSKG